MNMKIASLLIAAQVAGAQLHSTRRRQLRRDVNAGDNERAYANQGADGYFRHLEELSSMSMLQSDTNAASSAGSGRKPSSSKASKTNPLELRFGPQLSPEKVAQKFDKLPSGVAISSFGLQNFATPNFSTPLVDSFSTRGELAISFEEVESVCVTRCYNNPACEAVEVYGDEDDDEEKPSIKCNFFNPDLGPGAYVVNNPSFVNTNVVYTKKAGNTVIPSHDEVACDVSTSTAVNDVQSYYGCLEAELKKCLSFSNYGCFQFCALQGKDEATCALFCDRNCFFRKLSTLGNTQCVANLGLTNDFKDYLLPATDCLVRKGGSEEQVIDCLTCLTSEINEVQGTDAAKGICTANNDANFIRGTCKNECYSGAFSTCEPAIQSGMLCLDGSPEIGAVNRKDNTTAFACPK